MKDKIQVKGVLSAHGKFVKPKGLARVLKCMSGLTNTLP
jgi:hypothetical protein